MSERVRLERVCNLLTITMMAALIGLTIRNCVNRDLMAAVFTGILVVVCNWHGSAREVLALRGSR